MAEPQGTSCTSAASAVQKEPTPTSKEETPFVIKNPKGDCIRLKLQKSVKFNNIAFKIYGPSDEESDESTETVKFGGYEFEPLLLNSHIRSFDHKKYLQIQATKTLMIRLFSKIYVPIEMEYEANDEITELRGDSTEWPLVLLKRLNTNKEYDFNKMIPHKIISRLFDRNGEATDKICAHHVLQYDYIKPRQCLGFFKSPDVHIEGVQFLQMFHENFPWLADPALMPFFYVFPCSNAGYKTNTPTQFDFFYSNTSKTLTKDQTKMALEDYFTFKIHIDYLNQKLVDLRSLLEIDPITTGRLYTKNENKSTSDWIVAMNTLYPHNHTKHSYFFIGDCAESHNHNDYDNIIPHCENSKGKCKCVICQDIETPEYKYNYNKPLSIFIENVNRRCNIILNTMHVTMLKLHACREMLIRNGIIQTVNLDKYEAAGVYFHILNKCKTDINDCAVKITNFHPQARIPNYRIDDPVAIAGVIEHLTKLNEERSNCIKKSAAALKSKATYLSDEHYAHFSKGKANSGIKPYYLEIFNTPHAQVSKDDHKLIAYNIYNKQGKETSELFVKRLTERICNDIELNLHFDPLYIDEDPEYKPKRLESHLPSFIGK